MSGLNKALVMGRLGHDPSMKYLNDGKAICNLSIATSEAWKDERTGEKRERTEWHKAVAYGRTAEVIGEHFSKGGLILVEGKIQTRSWETKDGEKKYTTEIIVSNFQFCGDNGKPKEQKQGGDDERQPPDEEQQRPKAGDDDDIPF